MGVLTALLTATYMFRLVFMTFHGQRAAAGHTDDHAAAADHGHGGHLHDAPPAMAIPLIVLAIGSVLAGFVGVPHGLGGSNQIEQFLHPAFHPAASHAGGEAAAPAPASAEAGHEAAGEHAAGGNETLELGLAAFSVFIGLSGMAMAAFFFLANPGRADDMRRRFAGLHRLLLNKYYVDEAYDAAIVHPIKSASETVLWKSIDASMIDGAVNGTGALVRGGAMVLRAWQTGSVRTYAASLFVGVLLVIGYYLTR
jgi:NADH-quinone oxidoreductase subunit L